MSQRYRFGRLGIVGAQSQWVRGRCATDLGGASGVRLMNPIKAAMPMEVRSLRRKEEGLCDSSPRNKTQCGETPNRCGEDSASEYISFPHCVFHSGISFLPLELPSRLPLSSGFSRSCFAENEAFAMTASNKVPLKSLTKARIREQVRRTSRESRKGASSAEASPESYRKTLPLRDKKGRSSH